MSTAPVEAETGIWQSRYVWVTVGAVALIFLAATQALARNARDGGIALIRYQSVRDPGHGGCTALLTPAGFAGKSPKGAVQTWWLSVRQDRSTWIRGNQRHEFEFA